MPSRSTVDFSTLLARELGATGIELSAPCQAQLAEHYRLLVRWSRSVRLVGSLDPGTVVRRHVLESLALVPWVHERRGSLLDIGSGNGYPAIPIRVALPALRVAMMEPTVRKSLFLETVIAELELKDASVIRSRVDRPADLLRHGRWDCITMRAVAAIPVVMQAAPSVLRSRGRLLFLVGEAGRREVAQSMQPPLRLLFESRLEGTEGSYVVVVERVA